MADQIAKIDFFFAQATAKVISAALAAIAAITDKNIVIHSFFFKIFNHNQTILVSIKNNQPISSGL